MKKVTKVLIVVLCCVLCLSVVAGCGGEKDILVVSRESGSGTRDAFDGLIKNSEGDSLAKKADGTVVDAITKTADIQNSTGNVMTKVSSAQSAIGYISLGSLNSTVKSLTLNGVTATAENVLNNSYKLQRPFVIMTNKSVTLTSATQDFLRYLESSDAQKIVKASKYVEQASVIEYTAPASPISGKIVIKGSTSVDPLMDKLIADYLIKGGNKVTGVEFSKDAQGSAQGISSAKADTVGNVIGMSSSAIKTADAESLKYSNIALDAVAVIVNNNNTL
ncbi:MAG: substrate-binding domain-containing protein, partial [Clostridia bacterium]